MEKNIVQFLSGISPFSTLPETELIIIKQGSLELFYELFGKRLLSSFLNPGQVCGGVALLMNSGIAIRTVVAAADSELYTLSKEKFLDICNRFQAFSGFFERSYKKLMENEFYASIVSAEHAFRFLADIVPFSFLPESERREISYMLSLAYYPKNTVLFIQDQSIVQNLYILQKGAAQRYYEEAGKKNLRALLGEGDLYGGISMLVNDGVSVRTLEVEEESYFYTLSREIFLDICTRFETFSDFFTDTFGKRMLDRSYASIITKSTLPRHEGMQFFNHNVESVFNSELVHCDADGSIHDAANEMTRVNCSSIFIKAAGGDYIGVVTDKDLRSKVITTEYNIRKPVSKIMSSPLYTISSQALIFEALLEMMRKNIKHLAVTDTGGKVVGVVTNHDLLMEQGRSPLFLVRGIHAAVSMKEIIEQQNQLPGQIKNLISGGVQAKNVTRLVTTVSDAILLKLIGFALNEMEPPPAKFVFMVMGSAGRKEQTLKTDQDNAIVYEDVSGEASDEVRNYFLQFGEKVCNMLDQAGYAFCEGGIMAKNPRWCQPLSAWKKDFNDWIHAAEAEDLLQSSIFFDFTGAYGDIALITELRDYLFSTMGGWAGFFRHLTENALHFKPPLGFFRNFVVESKGKHRDAFDIKSAMMPIVDFARIYALKHKLKETNTLERLNRLYINKVLSWQEYDEIDKAYSFMMQLRFARQLTTIIDDNDKPDNYINPRRLSNIEQTMLREIFKRIRKFQNKLEAEFIGVM
ncbi:MAG: cyclic nucleotide-binding domain-containing protein [Desulfosarcina sp.]|nr:cyclic nucleotide-binding domain-containing protein [Desulfosarcina sp.]